MNNVIKILCLNALLICSASLAMNGGKGTELREAPLSKIITFLCLNTLLMGSVSLGMD